MFFLLGLRYIAKQLLQKEESQRMGMAGMLFHPLLQQRTIGYPLQYKPKKIEERVKRGQSRQLTNQIDCLLNSKNSSLIGILVSFSLFVFVSVIYLID